MEDLTPVPPEGVDARLLLAADLTEFYGGTDLSSASRIVVSQLKYSHRHPDRTWTAARLAEKGSHGKKGVIARLADLYTGIASTGERADVLERLEIRLVSNMPCSEPLKRAVGAAQDWLSTQSDRATRAALLNSLTSEARSQIERLSEASSLPSFAFTDFLRVFDLSCTGTAGRAEQELLVTEALLRHMMADLRYGSLALAELVRKRGMPDGEGLPIDRADVLVALEVYSAFDLLPAPSRFEPPEHRIRTPDAKRMAAALAQAPDRRLLAHGEAGVGKTTTILGVEQELPPGSVVLTYDCFGDSDYETPGAGRHDPVRFALQLCNELAARCRLPILVRPSRSVHDLWRELERRVNATAALLAEQGAELVIVVDAADNSAWAGRHFNEPTFLRQLWSQPIPEGAGLVVTCRTHRRVELEVPDDITQFELAGFDEAASAEYLRSRFPEATDDEALEFHRRSGGSPRVQFYVLFDERAAPAEEANEVIAQAQLTPKAIFEDLLAAAVAQAPDEQAARERLAELVCLTKPLTTSRFRAVSGMAASHVRAFCKSLVPGVVIEGDVIAFRDEDFATFMRDKVGKDEETEAHSRLADLFLGQPGDAYAATVVADHLYNARRDEDLVTLALDGAPLGIADGLARQQAYRRRLTLALRHAADVADRMAACQLVILAGEAARHDQAVAGILRKRPDLGMSYSDPEAVMRVYLDAERLDWHGPVHMQLAALYARAGDHERARGEGRAAHAWLIRRFEEEQDWNIDADDIGAYAEAWYHLDGADAAESEVRRWQPDRFAVKVRVALVRRLALVVSGDELGAQISERQLPAAVRARLLAETYAAGAVPAKAAVQRVAKELVEAKPSIAASDGSWAATFVELAAYLGIGTRRILAILKVLELPQPRHAAHRFERLGSHRDPLRMVALRAACKNRVVELEELMPASVTNPPDDRHGQSQVDSERRDMHDNVGRYIPVFASRARTLLTRPPVAEFRAEWEQTLQRSHEQYGYRRDPDFGYRIRLAAFSEALLACKGTDTELLALAADAAEDIAGSGAYGCWLSAARRLTRDRRYRAYGLRLIDAAAAAVEAADWPASQQAESLLDACAIADPVDAEQARELHSRAIKAAEGMDDEAIGRLELHARVAGDIAGTPAAAELAWRMAQALVTHRNRVSDDEHLPWRETLRAVARLHPPTGLALIARWEDDCHMSLHSTVPVAARPLVETGYLQPADSLALLPLAGERGASVQTATWLLERLPPGPERTSALAALSLRIRRDVLADERPGSASALIEWAELHDLASAQAVVDLRPYCTPARRDSNPAPPVRRQDDGESEWDRRTRLVDVVLARVGSTAPANVSGDLAELAELYGADRVPVYLRRVADATVPSKRGELIDVLGSIAAVHPIARHHAEDVLNVLLHAAGEWASTGSMRGRIAASITRFVETHLGGLTRYPGLTVKVLGNLLDLDILEDPARLILDAIGGSLERLDPPTLFSAASLLALDLNRDESAALLNWSLTGLEDEPVLVPELPSERGEVLASMFWSLFGAPDKATRWRAAHVARDLVAGGDQVLARTLLERIGERSAGAFASDSLPFHWLSAQLWTVMVLSRAARDHPASMAEFGTELQTVATDKGWPHAGIRELARRGALKIAAAVPGSITSSAAEELKFWNMPSACRGERSDYFGRTGSGNRSYETERFHFDSMDTVPYVYGPFGARFDLTVDEVCGRAETQIIDHLGLADVRRSDRRLELLDYSQRDNHRSRSPRGESWHQMLEEHALQLVAGELCDQGREIHGERGDTPPDPWTSWLDNWIDALDDGWIADERDPVPPIPALLLRDVGTKEWSEIPEEELRRAVGADDLDFLIVDSYVEYSPSFGYGSTYVTSALVSPQAAPALARALAALSDPREFGLPQERGYWQSENAAVDFGQFKLEGWIWEEEGGEPGLEEHDPLRRINLGVTRPGTRFLEISNGTLERRGRRVLGPDGSCIAGERKWSDTDIVGHARQDSNGTRGSETFVRRDTLNHFLRETNSVLILKAFASRHNSTRDYATDEKRDNDKSLHRVYLFDPVGGLVG